MSKDVFALCKQENISTSACFGLYGNCELCSGDVHLHIIWNQIIFTCVSCEKQVIVVGTFPKLALLGLPRARPL